MIEFIKTKKTYLVALAVLFLFVSLSETTYSLFLKSDTTDNFNYNTGLLDLEFIESEPIKLENAFPTKDSDVTGEPYLLTIKNTGNLSYVFDLKMLSDNDNNRISYEYIKVKVNDYLPHTLASTNNILDNNVIIYPNEEITYKIKIWLDVDTPNNELGKTFDAKVVASGKNIYKTLDNSGANHPKLNSDMIPVYYDHNTDKWKVADRSNLNATHPWYDYGSGKWANVITVKDSDKYIYDLTGRNNIKINDVAVDDGNLIIDDKYFDLNIKDYQFNEISNIFRVRFTDLNDNVYIIANDKITYYYNPTNKTFIFRNGNNTVTSEAYNVEKGAWYIIGYTYDGSNLSFYANGNKLSTTSISGDMTSSSTFKLGVNSNKDKVTKIIIGDVLFYNRILTDNEIANNYRTSLNIIYQNLLYGYSKFTPMNLKAHYLSSSPGTVVMNDDILNEYVWIPRYKYRLWNVLGENNIDTYDAYHKGVDIVFESLDGVSGTIYCTNNKCYSDTAKTIPVTANDNGKYYTHPAFSQTDKELTGFWVGKYEIGSNYTTKVGQTILTNEYLSTYYTNTKKVSDNADYHMIKNSEWGAIAYLSHSKYGLCQNNLCRDYGSNQERIAGKEKNDTTTGNAYGVYDMSGSAKEYTMGNITTTGTLNLNNSFFSTVPVGTDDYDLYQNGEFILGDATKETTGWYNTNGNIDLNNSWFVRNNIFGYNTINDIKNDEITTRIVIK